MERKSALKNSFHHNHPIIKGFYSPVLQLMSDPVCVAALRWCPPRQQRHLGKTILHLGGHHALGGYSITTNPLQGSGSCVEPSSPVWACCGGTVLLAAPICGHGASHLVLA